MLKRKKSEADTTTMSGADSSAGAGAGVGPGAGAGAGEPAKRQKREAYKKDLKGDEAMLPKKKFYRQRAHANPFSDHALA